MKTIMTGYFDHKYQSLEEQLKYIESFNIQHLCLRKYNGKSLLEIKESDIKDINNLLKVSKAKIDVIHTMIKPYDVFSKQKHDNAIDEFKFMIKLAEKLKVQHLFLELPIFINIIEEFEIVRQRIEDYAELAAKGNKKIIFLPSSNHKANTFAYIFKKFKNSNLSVAFDPVYFMMNNESATTTYRLLKGNIGAVMATDANQLGEPTLLGYGKTDILNIFKKMIRDGYRGYILMDNQFHESIFKEQKKKKGFFNNLFSNEEKKKQKALESLSKKIFPNEETKNVIDDDILENQIKVVSILFK